MADTPWDDEVRPLPSKEQAERFKGADQSGDIVDRLRGGIEGLMHAGRGASDPAHVLLDGSRHPDVLFNEAADTIKSLRDDVRRLRRENADLSAAIAEADEQQADTDERLHLEAALGD